MQALKGQLTLRGVAIGCVGCAIITAASAYTALKMGALPRYTPRNLPHKIEFSHREHPRSSDR